MVNVFFQKILSQNFAFAIGPIHIAFLESVFIYFLVFNGLDNELIVLIELWTPFVD